MQSHLRKKRVVILGAGISGLTAARAFKEAGYESIILEACPSAGGLTRTVVVDKFCFDYTGHFLHLARYHSPAEIPYAGLKNTDWECHERKSCCCIDGQLITAPIQYHLKELPAQIYSACVDSYNARPSLPDAGEISLRDYIISGFGRQLSDIFLIPQNEKTLAMSLDLISGNAVKRFFPPPEEKIIRAGMESDANSFPVYNSHYWYPRRGGIKALVQGLQAGLPAIHLLEEVSEIDIANRSVLTGTGQTWPWDLLLSSIPLPDLCKKTGDTELSLWAQELSHSTTIVFNLGVQGPLPAELTGMHWVYIPDRSIPFYRVGFYSNINKNMCPSDCSSLYVEVGLHGNEIDRVNIIPELQQKVIAGLEKLGWIKSGAIICSVVHIIRCAYVHHTMERERVIKKIFNRLKGFDIHPIGRYGRWDYISMEDSIVSAVETVKGLI
ncbi:MAG: NAD(P)-binding protein [Proteobacteria bacterium]|nr:NAD(P)-binding protein [Pseudomonadota bacterium]